MFVTVRFHPHWDAAITVISRSCMRKLLSGNVLLWSGQAPGCQEEKSLLPPPKTWWHPKSSTKMMAAGTSGQGANGASPHGAHGNNTVFREPTQALLENATSKG